MKLCFFSLLLSGFLSQVSLALPLLSENAAQNVTPALTLYPDSRDGTLFYYMPNTSGFQFEKATGLPMFGFTYWGLDKPSASGAGAYLTFTAHLYSDNDQRMALDAFIKSGKKVAVLPVMESTIGLSSSKGNSPLGLIFDEFNFSLKAGMAEDDLGVNAILTPTGANVFRKALMNPDLMKIDYCFKVQGLGPDFSGYIFVDYARVYDDFQFHASIGGFFTQATIDAEVEKLRQDGAITITINGGTAKDEEYLKSVAKEIRDRLFVPELQAKPTDSTSSGGWSFVKYSLKSTHREELKKETLVLTRRELVTREFCIPVTLAGLKPYYKDVVQNADANSLEVQK